MNKQALETREKNATFLIQLLAETFLVYTKTLNYHWNVTGPHFFTLHEVFEQQYKELSAFIDVIAERIRVLGFASPGSLKEFLQLAGNIQETEGRLSSAQSMVEDLLQDRQMLEKFIRINLTEVSQTEDEGTIDLLIYQLQAHQKAAWMLQAYLA